MRYEERHRFLWAALFAAVLILLVPGQASAHAGHDHGIQNDTPETVTFRVTQLAATTVDAGLASERSAVPNLITFQGGEKSPACLGGCCQASAACCAVTLPATTDITPPLRSAALLDLTILGRAGITLGALPEPPKALV